MSDAHAFVQQWSEHRQQNLLEQRRCAVVVAVAVVGEVVAAVVEA